MLQLKASTFAWESSRSSSDEHWLSFDKRICEEGSDSFDNTSERNRLYSEESPVILFFLSCTRFWVLRWISVLFVSGFRRSKPDMSCANNREKFHRIIIPSSVIFFIMCEIRSWIYV